MITSEQPVYAGQKHPCYGVNPVFYGVETFYKPWVFDGAVVHWLPPHTNRSDALNHAQHHARSTPRRDDGCAL